MDIYKIAVCDDEKIYQEEIVNSCNKLLDQCEVSYRCFSSGEELLASDYEFDFLFLDIEMGEMDGIQIKEILEIENRNVKIIFLTSHEERMIEAFGRNVIGFMKKPINEDRFLSIIKKMKIYCEKKTIEWENNGIRTVVAMDDIRYIEAQDKYTQIFLKNNMNYLVRRTLNEWVSLLPKPEFCRVHRSYIIHMSLFYMNREKIFLDTGKVIRLSRKNKSIVDEQYKKYVRKQAGNVG